MAHDEPVMVSRHFSSSDAETLVLVAFEINVDGRERFDERASNCDF